MEKRLLTINSKCDKIEIDINSLPIKSELSYSRIDLLQQCPYRYKLKYIDKNFTSTTSLALELGTLCHKGMELKYQNKDVKDIEKQIYIGFNEENKDEQPIRGLNELKDDYFFDYNEVNEKSGMNYNDKMKNYFDKLLNEPIDEEWECIGTEVEFKINYKNMCIIKGFIDRVDKNINTGDIRVIDYKTNNKEFDKSHLTTPLQMYIYSLACEELYGKKPIECIYDLLFLNKKQLGGTKGWLKRGKNKLDKLINQIIYLQDMGNNYYEPKPTPLCHWCDYCKTNLNADEFYNNLCEYHSMWTPENKTFSKNKEWILNIEDDFKDTEDDDWGDSWD